VTWRRRLLPGTPAPRLRHRAQLAASALASVDVWILITGIASVVTSYLTLVKPQQPSTVDPGEAGRHSCLRPARIASFALR
jgi:hypothetical protein